MRKEKTKLVQVEILSCYKNKSGVQVNLPYRMAWFTPDTAQDLLLLEEDVKKRGARLVISDGYRSFEMQRDAHNRYLKNLKEYRENYKKGIKGKKPKYSPPPGGSFHQAGRAIDVDLRELRPLHKNANMVLDEFWKLAALRGFTPIIKKPLEFASESWHFDHMGDFRPLYIAKGYKRAANEAINSIIEPY